MSRISETFRLLQQDNRKALIPFVTAGDPEPGLTPDIMRALAENGADLIELGMPFSDPMADGPAIQRANERALAQGVTLPDTLALVEQFRRSNHVTPVLLMGYLNPIERFGYQAFADAAAAAGVDGVIVVDAPPEESPLLNQRLRAASLDQVFLVTPTTTAQRMAGIARLASGFIYYVSVKGTTGGKTADPAEVGSRLRTVAQQSALPVAVGFGIRDAAMAEQIAQYCDAVVIGSALVESIHDSHTAGRDVLDELRAFMAPVRQTLDRAARQDAP